VDFKCIECLLQLELYFEVCTGSCAVILSTRQWWIHAGDGQPQTGGGDVLKQLNYTVVGLGDWAGLQDEQRWTLCTLRARILLQLLDSQYDARSKTWFG